MPIKKAVNGTYKVDISLGYNTLTKKRERTTRRGIKTLREAKEIERVLLNRNDNKDSVIGTKAIVVINEYLDQSRGTSKTSTTVKKEHVFKTYITPFLNDIKINDLTVVHARKFKESLMPLYLCTNYKRYIFTMMSSFLNYAVKYNYISKNPMRQVDNFKKEKVTMQYWTLSEFNTFIKCVDNILYKTIFWVLYYTGMRKGELLALTQNDINFSSKTININKACSYESGEGYVVSTPKTTESTRTIYINDKTMLILKEYIKFISNQYKFNKSTPLFSINGQIVPKESLRRRFKHYQRTADVKDIRIHDLRHSHVALLIYLKQDSYAIKKRLGHSSITTTLNTYGHLYNDAQIELVNRLDEI